MFGVLDNSDQRMPTFYLFWYLFSSQTESIAHPLPSLESCSDKEGTDGVELHADVGLVPVHVPHEPGVLLINENEGINKDDELLNKYAVLYV